MNSSSKSKVFAIDRDCGDMFDRPNQTGTPERNLLMAVLERAILDLVGNDPREAQAANDWIFGDLDDANFDEFTFPWLCQELDLDPRRIADTIAAIPKRGHSRIAPWYITKDYQRKVA